MTALRKIVVVLTAGTTMLAALGTAAQAGDWQGRGYGYGGHGGYGRHAPHVYHAPPPPPDYGHHPRRNRNNGKIAAGIAIGVGALIVGSMLANQGRRHRY